MTREGLDARLTKLKEVLPTLATRNDLREAIATAAAPLATRSEMLVLHEATRSDIQLLAESVLSLHRKVDALSSRG